MVLDIYMLVLFQVKFEKRFKLFYVVSLFYLDLDLIVFYQVVTDQYSRELIYRTHAV